MPHASPVMDESTTDSCVGEEVSKRTRAMILRARILVSIVPRIAAVADQGIPCCGGNGGVYS